VAYTRCSGFPGAPKLKAGIISIGRLHPPQTFQSQIDCATQMITLLSNYSGDPGSKYTFQCPSNCSKGGVTQGVGIYSINSSVCKAAVQMGVISDSVGG